MRPIVLACRQLGARAPPSRPALPWKSTAPRLDLSVDALRRARSRAIQLVLTSDAHHASELERIRFAALNAERAAISPDQVVNTWPAERLREWAQQKQKTAQAPANASQ